MIAVRSSARSITEHSASVVAVRMNVAVFKSQPFAGISRLQHLVLH